MSWKQQNKSFTKLRKCGKDSEFDSRYAKQLLADQSENRVSNNRAQTSNNITALHANHSLLQHSRRLHLLRIRRMRAGVRTLLSLHNLHRPSTPSPLASNIAPHAAKVPGQALSAFP
jgi:hypothetical protein